MDSALIVGIFTLLGAIIGGAASLVATRVDRRWNRAKQQIRRLCYEVAAFHKLEEFYKDEVAQLRPDKPASKTVLEEMRSRVEDEGDFIRPTMTSTDAKKILERWE